MSNNSAAVLSVSEISAKIRGVIEGSMSLRSVRVRGEISNVSYSTGKYGNKYLYFSLKDDKAKIECAMFEGVKDLPFDPKNGMSVVCEGIITVYPPRSTYQLKCYAIFEEGAGAAADTLEKLKAKLLDEGLFSQKRERPKFPRKIAVITSPSGAAIQDIKNVIARRYPVTELCVIPAFVQGVNAVPSLVEGLKTAQNVGADLIIFGRGGGSSEDLDCFNSEALARAIYASKIPTISAVGHEINTTIADCVADMRAATPSAAAELAVPEISTLKSTIDSLKNRSENAMKRTLAGCEARLSGLAKDVQLHSPKARIAAWESRLASLKTAVSTSIHKRLSSAESSLMINARAISATNPLEVLSRGYSVATKNGKAVKSAEELALGDVIDVKLNKGGVSAEVKKIEV